VLDGECPAHPKPVEVPAKLKARLAELSAELERRKGPTMGTSERDELAEVVCDQFGQYCHHLGNPDDKVPGGCPDCWGHAKAAATVILAAGYRKPEVVESAGDLDALPVGSVVLSKLDGEPGLAFQRGPAHWWMVASGNPIRESVFLFQNGNAEVTILHGGDR
jgi:hypothetical protein